MENQINKIKIALVFIAVIMFGSVAGAEFDFFFNTASALNGRSSSIGKIMSKYKNETKQAGPELRQANLALLWSISETASMCAILGGNVIGAAGMMDRKTRNSFMEMVNGSIDSCIHFISEKKHFLNAFEKVQDDRATKEFASELASQLRSMESEFNSFEIEREFNSLDSNQKKLIGNSGESKWVKKHDHVFLKYIGYIHLLEDRNHPVNQSDIELFRKLLKLINLDKDKEIITKYANEMVYKLDGLFVLTLRSEYETDDKQYIEFYSKTVDPVRVRVIEKLQKLND